MNKLLQLSTVIFTSVFISSCTLSDSPEKVRAKFLATTIPYSDVEPKNNEPKATLAAIQVGSSEFNASNIYVYDAYKTSSNGYPIQYRFGVNDDHTAPLVSELHGVNLPSDYVKAITQINIVPDKLFVFSVSVSRSKFVKTSWYKPDYTESVRCKWNYDEIIFMPKAGHDYLLSYGIKPTEEENKFLCILKLQEWDKKSKEYINVPFAPYKAIINKINKTN